MKKELKKLLKPTEDGWTDKVQEIIEGKALNSRIMTASPHNVEVGTVIFETLAKDMRELIEDAYRLGRECGYNGAIKDIENQGLENIKEE